MTKFPQLVDVVIHIEPPPNRLEAELGSQAVQAGVAARSLPSSNR